ncbi:hypothetical protein [Beijerinckia sp. L45]|uniref:hypothetical protein n=1 Tax=Beijerinckia sp. L45 TaxID=1641855 RepID=UPI00131E3300|nr:hypothetical protein [Beijerinckia sp. L45]
MSASVQDHFREGAIEAFASGHMHVTGGMRLTLPVHRVALTRNSDLDLVFELTSDASASSPDRDTRAGTLRAATDTIEFGHPAGWTAVARGVVWHHSSSRHSSAGFETVDTFTAHRVDIDLNSPRAVKYAIEWVTNVDHGPTWPDKVNTTAKEDFELRVGEGDGLLRMTGASEARGGSRALRLNIEGVHLYVMRPLDRTRRQAGEAQIVYQNPCDEPTRDRIRLCLSFTLGKPIVHLGTTTYCAEWRETSMSSLDAVTFDGAALRLFDLPPYPITEAASRNFMDQAAVERIVSRLFQASERLDFEELSWSYWYAVCAPNHSAAVHFGGLIEQLQRLSGLMTAEARSLLEPSVWEQLRSILTTWLDTAAPSSAIRPILEGKISSLNAAPAGLTLARVFDALGLDLGDVERKAWQARNRAAHGAGSPRRIEVILHGKVLRLMVHRLLAAITGCSDRYVDYHGLDFPIRNLADAVPAR